MAVLAVHRLWIRCASAASLLAFGVTGTAAPAPARDVAEFAADRLELDPTLSRLELRGHVAVALDRYRLRSDRLELRQVPGGVSVVGPGRVALCPCPDPPIAFGFRSAEVSLAGDLYLKQPTLLVAGVPVFWFPYLWLRPPDRVGLLPLVVAWRGSDGLLLGSGVHVPVAPESALDVGVAGYVDGGAAVDARLTTARSASAVRWDYLRQSSLAMDLRGALNPADSGVVAWSVDTLRGERALRGPALLEEVALREDRAQAVTGWAGDGAVIGVGAVALGARGGPIASGITAGPTAHAGWGGALGNVGTVDADVGVATLQGAGNVATIASQRAEVRADARAGVLLFDVEGRTRAVATVGERADGHSAAAGFGSEMSIPLLKEFGSADAPWQHWVTPFLSADAGITDTRAPSVVDAVAENGTFYAATGGLRSTIGETAGARGAASASIRAGYMGEGTQLPRPATAWSAGGRAEWLALHAEGFLIPDASLANVSTLNLRLGPEEGVFLEGHGVGQHGNVPVLARFFVEGWDAPFRPWLAAPDGWSVGGRLGVPWTRTLRSVADADYDLRNHTLLGVRGSVGYRHPCRCLDVTLWGGHRAGRSGVDSWIAVDLTP